jgi:hypothetical protein
MRLSVGVFYSWEMVLSFGVDASVGKIQDGRNMEAIKGRTMVTGNYLLARRFSAYRFDLGWRENTAMQFLKFCAVT